jgi:hypothetical protein
MAYNSFSPGFKWLIHANVIYSVGILISYIFIAIFMCVPVRYYWTIDAPPGHCMDEAVATLICGIINCVADLATTLTPLPLVIKVSAHDGSDDNMLNVNSFKCHAGSASRSEYCSA